MPTLPVPPDAYWATIPWWGYLGFVLVVVIVFVVIGPWLIQRARGRPSAMLSREQALTVREAAAQARQDAERERLEADRDRGWNLARGWTALAHRLWHDLNDCRQQRNSLMRVCQRMLDGRLPSEAAQDRLSEFEPLPPLKPLPEVDGVEPKRPGETKYA